MDPNGSGERSQSRKVNKRLKTEAGPAPTRSPQVTPDEQSIPQRPAKATRKRATKLAELPGMPLDVLFEIFGHLHPYDLLKLSRTTKDFRRLLTSRSSITVWKDSFATVPGLPECPPGMTEIAWANLVFSPHCHFCSSSNTRSIDWGFRFRICAKCAKEYLGNLLNLFQQNFKFRASLYVKFKDMFIQRREKRHMLCLKSDFYKVLEEYNALSDDASREEYVSNKTKSVQIVLEHARRCQIWETAQFQDRDTELRQLKEERLAAIKKKLIDLGWEKDLASMNYYNSLSTHKLANRPQRLTERVWANIKPGILEYMENIRAQRLKQEFLNLVSKRQRISVEVLRTFKKSKLAENLVMPRPPDFLEFEPVKEITNMPVEVEITLSSFDTIVPQLPGLIEQWRKRTDDSLAEILKKSPGLSDQGEDRTFHYDEFSEGYFYPPRTKVLPNAKLSEEQLLQKLKLASTVFKCIVCEPSDDSDCGYSWEPDDWFTPSVEPKSRPLFYPHVLGHQCMSLRASFWDWDIDDFDSMEEKTTIRKFGRLSIDAYGSKRAEDIIKLAGLDPATATADDMDNLDLKFVCNICHKTPESTSVVVPNGEENTVQENCLRPLFDWRGAVRHQKDTHFSQVSYTKLQRSELDHEITRAENDWRLENDREWRCIHCFDAMLDYLPMTFDKIKQHFQLKHTDLPQPIANEDCFQDFAAPNIHCVQPLFYVHSQNGHLSAYKTGASNQETPDSSSSNIYN